ncbi:MAG: hypothetical protein GDA39_10465 [Hyphomonadaceae bacterium]|nr:hypothetical protein [Hyphomonadaceae bacterium]MBC6413246.1 hypothetical protein [Hyphomonadaceae bacterium]
MTRETMIGNGIKYFSSADVQRLCPLSDLISHMELAFSTAKLQPTRQHIRLKDHEDFLVMPTWINSGFFGAKLVSVFERNRHKGFPGVQGVYCLFEPEFGSPVAIIDAGELTARRTAAASALASKYLSRADAGRLAVLGTGGLVSCFVEAHSCVREIEDVVIWGRERENAQRSAGRVLQQVDINVKVATTVAEAGHLHQRY